MNEETVLRYIFSRLAGGQNIALIAPTKGGKTELLQQIDKLYPDWLPNTSQWVFTYISAAEFGKNDLPADFWQKVWRAFAHQSAGQYWYTLLKKLTNNADSQPFSSNRIFRQLDKQNVRLVLLLDDLDQLSKKPHLFTPDL
ncbi:MAG: hypothetical protein GY797_20405, partial [Deltaproteobacteria bacterium]|nr:hypothetical protein [Deltaproteobacteria bacterium]